MSGLTETGCARPPSIGFDHVAKHTREDLVGWGAKLREACPVAYTEAHGGLWLVSRHEDIVRIGCDVDTFVSGHGVTVPPLNSPVPLVPAQSDAPLHSHYRSVLSPFLTAQAVREHETKIRSIVSEALDTIVDKRGGDAVADFAAKIPTRVMAAVFGFKDADAYKFDSQFGEVVEAAAGGDRGRQAIAVEVFLSFLRQKLEEGRVESGSETVVSAILRYERDGKTFDDSECLGLLWSTAGGAVETTKQAIAHSIYNLGANPDVRRHLIEDRSLIRPFVEEVLRLDAPVFGIARQVAKDIRVGDAQMKSGDTVLLVYAWANRDERVFRDPSDIVLTRNPNRHLAFGYGPHHCVGMHLARMEVQIAIELVLNRIPDYYLVDPSIEPHIRGGLTWSFDRLPIALP